MIPTISILVIIIAFSLYDYFTTKSWNMVTSKVRNETVFENRNKKYGAYQIRKDYDKRLLLILFGLTLGIGGVWGASYVFRTPITTKQEQTKIPDFPVDEFFDFKKDQDKDEQQTDETSGGASATTQQLTNIIPIDTPTDETKTEVINPNINSGTETSGETGSEFDGGSNGSGTGNGSGDASGSETSKPIDDNPVSVVDVYAEFPGGMSALRKYIAENMDISVINGTSKIYLRFVVDIDGSISSVEVTNNTENCKSCEKAAIAVVKSMPRWKPARVGNKPVKSYFRLPITIQ